MDQKWLYNWKGKTILVVEDDKFLLSAYKMKLSKENFEVETVLDGEEAILKLETFIPDIILLDLIMPKKDGFEVLKIIKSQDKWKTIPVIITSNLGQKEDIDHGMAMGAVDYFVKSDLSLEQLLVKINSVLNTQ